MTNEELIAQVEAALKEVKAAKASLDYLGQSDYAAYHEIIERQQRYDIALDNAGAFVEPLLKALKRKGL